MLEIAADAISLQAFSDFPLDAAERSKMSDEALREDPLAFPLQISFHGFAYCDAAEASIRKRAGRLEQFSDRIVMCRVIVETPYAHRRKGKLYHVRIDLTVPGAEMVVGRDPAAHHAHADIYVAIRDAFDDMRRQLEDHVRRARGNIGKWLAPPG